jgi:hypothetical protein
MFSDANDDITKHEKDEPIRISGFHNFGFGSTFNDLKQVPIDNMTSSIVTLDNPVDISENTAHSRRSPDISTSGSPPLSKGYYMRQNSLYAQSPDPEAPLDSINENKKVIRNPFSSQRQRKKSEPAN